MLPKSITLGKNQLICLASQSNNSFLDNFSHLVISVVPENESQFRYLLEMQSGAFDFWSAPAGVGKVADLRVSPEL